jgi:hypothetical protein
LRKGSFQGPFLFDQIPKERIFSGPQMKWIFLFLTFSILCNSIGGVVNCHLPKIETDFSIFIGESADHSASEDESDNQDHKNQDCSKFCCHHVVFFVPIIENPNPISVRFGLPPYQRFIPSVDLRKPERPPLV